MPGGPSTLIFQLLCGGPAQLGPSCKSGASKRDPQIFGDLVGLFLELMKHISIFCIKNALKPFIMRRFVYTASVIFFIHVLYVINDKNDWHSVMKV